MRRLFPHPGFSLQRRLALALAGCVTACWLAGTVAAGLVLREEISEVFDSALQEVAQGVLPLAYAEILERGNDGPPDTTPNRIASVGPHREYIAYVVRDASGRVLLMSHDADLSAFPTTMQPGFVDGPVTRLYTEAAVQGTLFVTTAERPGHRRTTVLQATRMLVLPLVVLLPLVGPQLPPPPPTGAQLTLVVLGEIFWGLVLGLGVRFLLTAWAAAGDLISYMIGFQAAQVFDPAASSNTTAPSQFLTLVGLTLMFSLNFHHTMLLAWVESYQLWVPGQTVWPVQDTAWALLQAATHALELGLRLAAPVALTGFMIYLGFGLLNKLVPNIQAFFLSVPLTLLVGILVLGLALGGMLDLYATELATQGLLVEIERPTP